MLFYPPRLRQFSAQETLVPAAQFFQLLHQLHIPKATSAESSAAAPNKTCSTISPFFYFLSALLNSCSLGHPPDVFLESTKRYSVGIQILCSTDSQTSDLCTAALRGKKTHIPLHPIFTNCLRTPMGNIWLTKPVSALFLGVLYWSREAVFCSPWVVTGHKMKCQEFGADIIQHLNIMRLQKEMDTWRQMSCGSLINKVLFRMCERKKWKKQTGRSRKCFHK